MRVRDYMSTNVHSLEENARLLDAALLIRTSGKRHVPILSAQGTVSGVVSDRDIYRLSPSFLSGMSAEEYNLVFEKTPVTAAMSSPAITVGPDENLRDAVELLYSKRIGCLPVVDGGGRLVGILTINDMLGLLNELLAAGTAPASEA
jgi:CBS domain-containing protein